MKQFFLLLLSCSFLQISAQGPFTPPYVTDFNSYSTEAEFLTDWSYQNNLPSDQAGVWGFDNTAYFGYNSSNCPFYFTASTSGGNDWLFSPELNLVQGTVYSVSFLYAGALSGYTEKLSVYVGSGDTSSAMTQLLHDFTAITSDVYTNYSTTFTVSNTGVYNIGFLAGSDAGNFGILIDNFSVDISSGISSISTAETSVYPNPCDGILHMTSDKLTPIALYTSDGRLLYETEVTGTLNLSAFDDGVYFLRIDHSNTIPLLLQKP